MKFPLPFFSPALQDLLSPPAAFIYFKADVSFSSNRDTIYFVPHRFSVKVNATSQDVVIKEKLFPFHS
jgi:hypothetical protein